MLLFSMLSVLFFIVALVDAHPAFEKRQSSNSNGANSSSSSNLPPQIWIPILVLAVVIVCVSVVAWSKRSLRATLAHISQGAAAVSGATTFTSRELTAEQLAGSINAGNNSTPAPRSRRTRRPASQISTTSLPAYMKEPGDQELVIYRGPADMEDMPVHQEEEDIAESYETMPVSPQDMPLMDDDSSSLELPAQPPGEGMPLREERDPRGATPSYFEVVDLNEHTGERRSSLLGFLGSRNQNQRTSSMDIPLVPTSHARNQSSSSVESTGVVGGSTLSLHRTVSSSFLSNLRRKKSTNTLNSMNNASTLSVNSISAPLTHTLQKTEFTYPRSGPTPEQVKLISSRDSFVKFGRPYGADAIAFAASASRQALEPSPPDFEESQEQRQQPSSTLVAGSSEGPGSTTPVVEPSEDNRESQPVEEIPPVLKIETSVGRFRPLSTILSAATPIISASDSNRVSMQEDHRGSTIIMAEGNRRTSLITTVEGSTTEGNHRPSMQTTRSFTTALTS